MKITILLLFVTCFAFGQNKEVKTNKVKVDTMKLADYQLQNLIELDKEITEIKQVLEAKQREQNQFLNGLLSIYGDPKKLTWEFKQPNLIIIKK